MRGDLALEMRLVLRREGAIGLAGAVAGAAGVVASYLPWYTVHATVSMLDETRTSAVASLPGWQAQPWIWTGTALAALAVALGVAIALDRPPRWWREGLLTAAIALASVAGISALVAPPWDRFMADAELQRLQSIAERVPRDVEVAFSVTPATGVWVALATAAVLLATALAARKE